MNRRRMLTGIAAGLPFLSGCAQLLGSDEGSTETQTKTNTETTTQTATATQTTTPTQTAATAAQTATTATQTATTTATRTTTSVPTTTGTPMTTGTTSTFGSTVKIDPSNLKTYTSQDPPFSIEYPAGWNKTQTEKGVSFISYSGGFMVVVTLPAGSASLDRIMTNFLRGYTRDADTSEISPSRNVTLPNGNSAKAVDIETSKTTNTSQGTRSTSLHAKALFVLVDGTVYIVVISVPQDAYTSSIDKGMTACITSLTVG